MARGEGRRISVLLTVVFVLGTRRKKGAKAEAEADAESNDIVLYLKVW